jgi:hypothetical protein
VVFSRRGSTLTPPMLRGLATSRRSVAAPSSLRSPMRRQVSRLFFALEGSLLELTLYSSDSRASRPSPLVPSGTGQLRDGVGAGSSLDCTGAVRCSPPGCPSCAWCAWTDRSFGGLRRPEAGASFLLFGLTTVTRSADDTEGASCRPEQTCMLIAAARKSPDSSCQPTGPSPPWAGSPRHPTFTQKALPRAGASLATRRSTPDHQCCINCLELLQPARGHGRERRNPQSERRICRFRGFAKAFFSRIRRKKGGLENPLHGTPEPGSGEDVTQRDKAPLHPISGRSLGPWRRSEGY